MLMVHRECIHMHRANCSLDRFDLPGIPFLWHTFEMVKPLEMSTLSLSFNLSLPLFPLRIFHTPFVACGFM